MFQAQLLGMIAKERYKDSLRQAERDRLALLASAGEGQHHWNWRALVLIGSKLTGWGDSPQKHHVDSATSTLPIASDAR